MTDGVVITTKSRGHEVSRDGRTFYFGKDGHEKVRDVSGVLRAIGIAVTEVDASCKHGGDRCGCTCHSQGTKDCMHCGNCFRCEACEEFVRRM